MKCPYCSSSKGYNCSFTGSGNNTVDCNGEDCDGKPYFTGYETGPPYNCRSCSREVNSEIVFKQE